MTDVSTRNFGYLIAYILPGVVTLAGLSRYSEIVRSWFVTAPAQSPTVGGFLFLTLASVAVGMTVSAIRWLVLDTLHHATGIQQPHWDFSVLQDNYAAFDGAVENHYRYYQCYSNMQVAIAAAVLMQWPVWLALFPNQRQASFALLVILSLFFLASRDALAKYYARTSALLSLRQCERSITMTNGWHKEKQPAAKEPTTRTQEAKATVQPAANEKPRAAAEKQSK